LGFSGPSLNSMDAVADRDYVVEFLASAAIFGLHCSRLAADLTLWATAEFGFVEFPDAFATGSPIMPPKKNPDVAELTRGKTGRLYGNLTAVLTTMKGLPMTYNSDMQEDKEPLFDTVDTLEAIFRVLPPMLRSLTFRTERMREAAGAHYATATDLADYLVRQGLPFREAHEVVGRAVRHAIAKGCELADVPLEELRGFSSLIGRDVYAALTVEASLRARAVVGGTAPDAVRQQLAHAKALLERDASPGGRPPDPSWPSRSRSSRWPPAARRGRPSLPSCGCPTCPGRCAARWMARVSWSRGLSPTPGSRAPSHPR